MLRSSMEKSLFLEKIMDTAWLIKQEYPRYRLSLNVNRLAIILQDAVVYEDDYYSRNNHCWNEGYGYDL